MSHSFRQPIGAQQPVPVAQTALPGRMVAPICTTGSPAVYPVMPNAYGLLTQQPQQYLAQPMVYPQALPNVQNGVPFISTVPSNVPRMFVPVATVPPGISPSVPDPAKILEEQRKIEKERNFQLQQERLKQFTVAGKKPNVNADNLIDSMFGKIQPKKASGASTTSKMNIGKEINEDISTTKSISFEVEKYEQCPTKSDTSLMFVGFSTQETTPAKKDAKEIDFMMLECSNLNAPSKASKFQKQTVKEITGSSSQKTTFTASEKAIDWKNMQGLEEIFTAPKPRFPSWCSKEKVPELYKKVEAVVTHENLHAPDTSLLFPIFVSSGLPRELLGQIWELVNESGSGQLSVEEMYAALALIAVAQAGHSVKSIGILHKIQPCPLPQLNFFTSAGLQQNQMNMPSPISQDTSKPETSPAQQPPDQLLQHAARPAAISLTSHMISSGEEGVANVTQNLSSWTPFAGSTNTPDDDFDDFKSATPTAINFPMATPTSQVSAEDDFDEFKQAPCVKTPTTVLPAAYEASEKHSKEAPQDLMSPEEEDKYSVFRTLQQAEDTCQWGDFAFSSVPNNSSNVVPAASSVKSDSLTYPSVLVTESGSAGGLFQTHSVEVKNSALEEDEFGDFVHASVAPPPPSTTTTDFADFSNFKQFETEHTPVSQVDDEFGEFTSSVPISLKPELGHEFLFHHLKDNISLAESQSVSSLELGTFDGGGGHSGESKSSLSRQGSIPSLDLKSVGLDTADSEDGFGELQFSSFVPRNSKSPSPISNTKESTENEVSNPVGQFFQASALPLTDKYSVIRQEKMKEEDQHVSCWTRCLQSAINILKCTKKIFNQMSCSSVCNEVIRSEEGTNYVKNVIEIYKVICRVGLVSKSFGKQTEAILDLLNEADQLWNTICGFFAGSSLMPEESSLNFSSSILRPEPENNAKACGLCLLNIELRSKSFKQEECPKLSYGGRNYHSTCANFWINCVDPLLPALTLPQLL